MAAHEAGLDRVPVQSVAKAQASGKTCFLYLDNLRMMVITFVILEHLAITYGIVGDWYYSEAGKTGTVFGVTMMLLGGIGAAFAMGLLFLIAGYFTPRAYDRKGAGRFLVDRLKRLGLIEATGSNDSPRHRPRRGAGSR